MRGGAFFVVCDEYSKTSEVYKMLTETNLALPLCQFFDAAEGHASLQQGTPPLAEAVRVFVNEERASQQYRASRTQFAASVFSMGMITSVGTAAVALSMNSASLGAALVTIKCSLGNVQILSSLAYSFRIDWPPAMLAFVSGMHILVLDIWSAVDIKCMLGAYTYAHKLYAAVCLPVCVLLLVTFVARCCGTGTAVVGSLGKKANQASIRGFNARPAQTEPRAIVSKMPHVCGTGVAGTTMTLR